jgi:catechol 2,3-dioxygenase-like lactoylglutathione lyase family enzyme
MDHFPYTQLRVARPTNDLEKTVDFYVKGLGLPVIGNFSDHEGYSGVMLGLPGEKYHLEFTQRTHGLALTSPSPDNLLVFYLENELKQKQIVRRLKEMGYPSTEPENPYWKKHGITVEDPDGWRVVLMKVPGFKFLG